MSSYTAVAPPTDKIARGDLRRQIGSAFAFALVLFCVYQTLSVTDVTDDVIRKGIEADAYEMIWPSVSWICMMIVGLFLAASATPRYGSRLILVAGLAVFALGNLIAGMAGSLAVMIIGRGVEGSRGSARAWRRSPGDRACTPSLTGL